MKIRCYENADGTVSVAIHPLRKKQPNETEGEYFTRANVKNEAALIKLKPHLAGRSFVDIDESKQPQNRRFRNTWRLKAGKPQVDLPLARIQLTEEVRVVRNKLLDTSDKEILKRQEQGTSTTTWKTYRQKLRDLPTTLNLNDLKTVEALEKFKPKLPTVPNG